MHYKDKQGNNLNLNLFILGSILLCISLMLFFLLLVIIEQFTSVKLITIDVMLFILGSLFQFYSKYLTFASICLLGSILFSALIYLIM